MGEKELIWHKVAGLEDLPEGRVKVVTAGSQTIALTHVNGEYGALDNRCAHQGGPLGEGSIENNCLRCPWHGWDFDPLTRCFSNRSASQCDHLSERDSR